MAGVTAACAGGGDDGDDAAGTTTSVTPATPADAALPPGAFALGVASGDPLTDRVMLWTRLASDPLVEGGGSPEGDVEVAFDVAIDADFADLVVSGVATATDDLGHSVHVDVSGLEPDTWYHYRFRAGDQTSPVGRTRTFPAAGESPEQFRFVFASCQDLQWGEYGAWGRAAELSDVDAVVFLGDYVYELNLGDLSPDRSARRAWAGPEPETVVDYRRRYAQTKADLQLQAAHEMAPWIVTFDDHEVSNNYAGDVGQADIDQPASRDRRLAAYQAWYEHTPIRLDPLPTEFAELDVHRSFDFGDLARVYAIETRQRADVPACRTDGSLVSDEGPLCEAAEDEARSNLGADQEQWLVDALADSATTWNVLANPIMLAGLNLGTAAEPSFTRDAWDGYPAARRRLLERDPGQRGVEPGHGDRGLACQLRARRRSRSGRSGDHAGVPGELDQHGAVLHRLPGREPPRPVLRRRARLRPGDDHPGAVPLRVPVRRRRLEPRRSDLAQRCVGGARRRTRRRARVAAPPHCHTAWS